jgi:hypothetical protein
MTCSNPGFTVVVPNLRRATTTPTEDASPRVQQPGCRQRRPCRIGRCVRQGSATQGMVALRAQALQETLIAVNHQPTPRLRRPRSADGPSVSTVPRWRRSASTESDRQASGCRWARVDRSRPVFCDLRGTCCTWSGSSLVRGPGSATRPHAGSAARPAAWLGDDGARRRGSSEGGSGAARSRQHRHHPRCLKLCDRGCMTPSGASRGSRLGRL